MVERVVLAVTRHLASPIPRHEAPDWPDTEGEITTTQSGRQRAHHLKVLREAGIIDCERRGTWVYYWLIPSALERMAALLSAPAS
jgi:DNA-binding transcriptional ArsR family regulator